MLSAAQTDQFKEAGYVILEQGIAAAVYEPARAAAERVTARARRGDWSPVRSVPGSDGDIWGVSNLLHPDLGEPAFAAYMATDEVLQVARELLGDDQIRLSLTNMLVNPIKADYAIAWHRDAVDGGLIGEDELAVLRRGQWGVQWNAALCEEACLRIVPGTHRRNLTAAEREVLDQRPMTAMPGEVQVRLRPRQTVYYNANLLHKGDYVASQPRLTLHANLVSMAEPVPFAGHYEWVRFMEQPGFKATLPAALYPLLDNWLAFANRYKATMETKEREICDE